MTTTVSSVVTAVNSGKRVAGHLEQFTSGRDGGGDGDFSGPPSSFASQAGSDRYGPKRWTGYQKTEMKEVELFKQRKTLPKLTLGPGWKTMQPALVCQIHKDWKSKIVKTVGTWGHATHD
eukprot:4876648-Amphidinium_carterae.1